MKRKLIISLLALVSAATLAIGLSACNKKPVHEHEFEEVVVAPTCTEDGYTVHTCFCGDEYTDDIVPATGHTWGEPVWTWSGYESATATFTCTNDSTHVETETATGSAITSEVTTTATCTTDGVKAYTATVTFGNKTYSGIKNETLVATGHSYSEEWESDAQYHWHAATCEHSDEISGKANHTYANGQCTVCGKVQPPTEGLTFTLNSAGDAYSCSGIGSASSVKDIIIPSTYNDLPVTTIATNAFKNTYITSVTIPESVTTIEYYAFRKCSYLTTVNITEKTTNISSDAFYETTTIKYNEYDNAKYLGNAVNPYVTLMSAKDTSITSCTIHKDTKLIMNNAFTDCTSLTGITIPGSVSKIGDSAFRNCAALVSATISEGVTTIGWRVFSNCSALTSIVIPNSVTSIDVAIFDSCTSLEEVTLGNGIDAIKASMFYNCTSLTSIEIPNSVTNIEGNAFYGCTKLKTVTIPSGVTEIGNSAFYNCSSITSLTIPDNIQRIGEDAFYGCNLQYNTYGNANYLGTTTNDYAILISVIDKSVTSFEIHSGTKIIYARAFYNCTALTNISIPDGVVCIGGDAFSNCTSLSSVTMTDSVTYVESSVFSECTSLTSVSMGNGIEYIGSYIFMSVSAKISIAYNGTVQQWNAIDKHYGWNGAFVNANANITVTCTDGTVTP
ncbi:MAG: leucine-rich repeat domain-containing protein [Candidatus Coproplasma sp.]